MNILIIGNGFDLEHNIKICFQDFVNSDIFQNQIKSHKKFFINDNKNNQLWSQFEEYCFSICSDSKNKINKIKFWKKINIIFYTWLSSLKEDMVFTNLIKSDLVLSILKEFNPWTIFSFNYTETPQIYQYEDLFFQFDSKPEDWKLEKLKNKYVNLHYFNSNKKSKNYILGHDLEVKINKNFWISKWDEKKNFNPKNNVLDEVKNSNLLGKIIFYGFSFGDSDINILKWLFDIYKINQKVQIIIYTYDKKSFNDIKENINRSLKGKSGITKFKESIIYKYKTVF